MTVVEVHAGGTKLHSPADCNALSNESSSLLIEAIAQNTSGSVFEPEVSFPPKKKLKELSSICFVY